MLLALLAASCGKSSDGRIRLFAEHMTQGSGAKVLFNPANLDAAEWVAGETININGNTCTIVGDAENGYSIDGSTVIGNTLYAIYPATINDDGVGNNILVTNGGSTGPCGVDIRVLAVNMHSDGRHDVCFPMAASAPASDAAMTFRHLTGGLKIHLTTNAATEVYRLVISATKADNSPAIYRDIAPSWAGSLMPSIPINHGDGEDQGIQFYKDILLRMSTDGTPGVTIPAGTTGITFCIPMLAQQLKSITVTGYDLFDDKLFEKTKTLPTAKDIERNKMYTIPTIDVVVDDWK